MQNILYHWTLKNWPKGASSMSPPPSYIGETLGVWTGSPGTPPLVPRDAYAMNFSKHLLTDWFGVSTVGVWNCVGDRGILRYVRAQKWEGGGDLLPPPLPWKVGGGERPLPRALFLRQCLW